MIRVLVIEDVPLFRLGLRLALEQAGDFHLLGETTELADILQQAQSEHPDVILLHEGLTAASALAIATHLHQEIGPCGLFVWATSGTEEQVFAFLLAGAAAYERRSLCAPELLERLRRVASGEYLISSENIWPDQPPARRQPLPHLPTHDDLAGESTSPLYPRELQVLNYIARGWTNQQIAQRLQISDQTVKNYITAIFRTLEVADRTRAVVVALRQAWITFASIEQEPEQEAEQLSEDPPTPLSRRRAPLRRGVSSPIHQVSAICYRSQKTSCGKANCRPCREGIGHGPYWYSYQIINGRTVRRYLGKTLPEGVMAGQSVVDLQVSRDETSLARQSERGRT
jgi:DNA-binding NarL/FixJ family response regulator